MIPSPQNAVAIGCGKCILGWILIAVGIAVLGLILLPGVWKFLAVLAAIPFIPPLP